MHKSRRDFVLTTAAVGSCAFMPLPFTAADEKKAAEPEISAPEDLMREHGVLNRILLIYEEAARRLRSKEELPPDAIHQPAMLARKFVEDYHEKLEETHIFPAFEKRRPLDELVATLKKQHDAGRRLTDVLLRSTTADQFTKAEARQAVIAACEAYVRMYRPHEAREDTILFPALYKAIGEHKVKELGEQFEEQEQRLLGEDGFHRTVEEVAAIEKQLGIYDLARFTPH